MRPVLQRPRRVLRRVADLFPPTALGLLVGGAAAAALDWLAYGDLDLVQLVVGYGALGVIALALVVVIVTALVLKLTARGQVRDEPLRAETGRLLPTGFSLPALRWVPLLQVRWDWDGFDLPVRVEQRRVGGRLHEEVTLMDRGEAQGIVRRIVVQDVFGLVRLAVRHRDPLALHVVPGVGALGRMPVLQSFAGGDELPHPMGLEDGDRVELRRYIPGDPARFIHWKVFGRTRKLVVRMPERALSRARRVIAYLVAGPDDDATAGAARVAVEMGALGTEWTFCADGADGDARTVSEAMGLIVRSIRARERGALGLRDFLARSEREGPAAVVVFAPPRGGAWLDRVTAVARARRGRVRVVIAVDGLRSGNVAPWWRRALLAEVPREGVASSEIEPVLRALEGVGCEVVLLDRPTGRRLGAAHRAAVAGERLRVREGGAARGERHAA